MSSAVSDRGRVGLFVIGANGSGDEGTWPPCCLATPIGLATGTGGPSAIPLPSCDGSSSDPRRGGGGLGIGGEGVGGGEDVGGGGRVED